MRIKSEILRSAIFFAVFTVICGGLYTAAVTGAAQLLFPRQANAGIITAGGAACGSALIGQPFSAPGYLWGRPMAIDVSTFRGKNGERLLYAWPVNVSPASKGYAAAIASRVKAVRAANPAMGDLPVPEELVTYSGSGLDPQISPAAAQYQAARIASARGMSKNDVIKIIENNTDGKFLGLFGEDTVNVLKVNLTLDGKLK